MDDRPDKVEMLQNLQAAGFDVPGFVYLPAERLARGDTDALAGFLQGRPQTARLLVRSAHPEEAAFKGGTFDSFLATPDLDGVRLAWRRMVRSCRTAKRLSIRRQQVFWGAPSIDPEEMGALVMPFIEGPCIMAKALNGRWEFGVSPQEGAGEPYLTTTAADEDLLAQCRSVRDSLGVSCEIEWVRSAKDGRLYLVQARDISRLPTAPPVEEGPLPCSARDGLVMDGLRRVRDDGRRRQRPVFVMDSRELLSALDAAFRDPAESGDRGAGATDAALSAIHSFEGAMERFALSHERYAVLAVAVHLPDLYGFPERLPAAGPGCRKALGKALRGCQYAIERFLAEADTLVAQEGTSFHPCTHAVFGISSVSHPLWSVSWKADRRGDILDALHRLGVRTGRRIEIALNSSGLPELYSVPSSAG